MKNQRQNMIKKVKLFRFDIFYSKLRAFEKIIIKSFPKIFSKIKKLLKTTETGSLNFKEVHP
jgi:hypothetical protein